MAQKKVFVIIIDKRDGKILVGKNTLKHRYEYFGGGVEFGETFAKAASRELYEETSGTIYISPSIFKDLDFIKSNNCRIYILPLDKVPTNKYFLQCRNVYKKQKLLHYLEMNEIRKFNVKYILKNPNYFSKYLVENLKLLS
jgi:hypothetical protein